MDKQTEKQNKDGSLWQMAVEICTEVSTWVVVPIIIALIGGKYLDKHFGTKPVIFLVCIGVSFCVSSFGIVKVVGRYLKQIELEAKDKKEDIN